MFYKDQYRTLDKAMSKIDGLVILAVLLGVRKTLVISIPLDYNSAREILEGEDLTHNVL